MPNPSLLASERDSSVGEGGGPASRTRAARRRPVGRRRITAAISASSFLWWAAGRRVPPPPAGLHPAAPEPVITQPAIGPLTMRSFRRVVQSGEARRRRAPSLTRATTFVAAEKAARYIRLQCDNSGAPCRQGRHPGAAVLAFVGGRRWCVTRANVPHSGQLTQ